MATGEGQSLIHYRLAEKIGEGGMGEVWKATDTKLEREVAIKVLPESFGEDPTRLSRFRGEARNLAALNHPNIVTIYSVEEADGRQFFTMELVRGKTFKQLLPERGLPLGRFLELAIPVTEAITAAHQRGITHRDLKPGNIMVSDEDRVKVLDFGLARAGGGQARSDLSEVTTRSSEPAARISGSVPYMSPEQIRGEEADHRSDIFALGIIFYELLTGRRPFDGKTAIDLMASILKDPPRPATEIHPDLPAGLWRILQDCLAKDPEERPQTTEELKSRLENLGQEMEAARDEPHRSIAVLPFVDMSQGRDQGYLCEGIAEEIINALTRIQDLRVASRTSSFCCRDANLESREIGQRLQVETLLEGSVRQSGDRLRVTVQLINVADGYHLWSERYDRRVEDVFAIQDEIARMVVDSLQLTLSPREESALKTVPASDVQAYDFYLRGRQYYYQYRRKGMEYALDMFSRAIDLDPGYAPAYAGLADCRAFLFLYAGHDPEHRRRALGASRKALELDPDLAQAHASRGVALTLSGDHLEAEKAFETAIRLDPRLFEAFYFYARDCFVQGKFERAIRLYEKAAEIRPEDYQIPLLSAQIYDDLGRPEDAAETRRRGLRVAEEHLKLNPDDARALYLGANALVVLGEIEQGLEWARDAQKRDPDESMLLYNVGCTLSLAGQVEEAIDTLERSVANGLTQKEWFENDNNLDPLRSHPRFQALLERIE